MGKINNHSDLSAAEPIAPFYFLPLRWINSIFSEFRSGLREGQDYWVRELSRAEKDLQGIESVKLTPHARQIYKNFKTAIAKQGKGKM